MSGMTNPKIRAVDTPILDKVFGMEGGYVLDFTDRTFAEFFRDELREDIDDPRWALQGRSKAKRLRYFLRNTKRKTVLDTLNALWEYREVSILTHDYPALDDRFGSCTSLVAGVRTGATGPRLCIREVPEGYVRCLRVVCTGFLPPSGRADRRQLRVGRRYLSARSKMD